MPTLQQDRLAAAGFADLAVEDDVGFREALGADRLADGA